MRELVAGIDDAGVGVTTPLVVIIDELDRCRPDYAIRVLEEIKHFFDVPGVVFILAIYGKQLEASISAVYGEKFASEDYLRRFFDRRWDLRRLSASEIVSARWAQWGELGRRFSNQKILMDENNVEVTADTLTTYIFDAHAVTAREALAVLDALRLFAQTWSYDVPISALIVVPMAINLVRRKPAWNVSDHPSYQFSLPSRVSLDEHSYRPAPAAAKRAIEYICSHANKSLWGVIHEELTREPDYNYSIIFMSQEAEARRSTRSKVDHFSLSLVSEYADRLERIAGLVERVATE